MTAKRIKSLLLESCFNPKTPGPMKIVSEINNIEYFKGKAIECINLAGYSNPQENLRDAISILALARCYLKEEENDPTRI